MTDQKHSVLKDKIKNMSEDERNSYMEKLSSDLMQIHESDKQRIIKSNKLIEFAHICKNNTYEGIGYYHLAAYFNSLQSRYSEFKPAIQKSIDLLKNTEAYTWLSSAYLLLGVDAINFGQYNLNLDYFMFSRHYAGLIRDELMLSIVDYYFAGFYIMVGDMDNALKYAKSSVGHAEKTSKRVYVFGSSPRDMAYSMIGQCYVFLGQFDKAYSYYKKSIKEEKQYTPSPDCPNTALIYAFHIMALHVAFKHEERDARCEEFIEVLRKHKPSPPFIMHILNINLFLLKIGQIEYAKKIIPFLVEANKKIKNPNFGLLISYQKVIIAQKEKDEDALVLALKDHYMYYIQNNDLVLENLRVAAALRLEMDDIQNTRNELKVLKAANEAKSQFLSNMSHEMRTPLNSILGMDEIILRETKEDNIYGYAENIKTAGNTLLSIINDVLDSSKIEAGKMDIIPVEYDLGSVVNDLVNMIEPRTSEKGLEFKVNIDSNIPYLLYGDEIRIKQCVLNILTNAVKYTEKGSVTLEVTARCMSEKKKWDIKKENYKKLDGTKFEIGDDAGSKEGLAPILLRFRVVDTGIGIKEEDIPKLTRPFERIEEERNRTIEGTGLGMNIVKNLLKLMGSKLELSSVYGQGSDFSFELVQGARTLESIGDYAERYKKNTAKRENYKASFVAPKARVLIVDDTSANLTVAKGLLKPTKIQVDTATSGKDTLELVKHNKYDLLFIDHRMPEMDGVETLNALKNQDDNLSKDAACVVLTANVISGARDTFLEQGFDDYLAKPIDTDKLERILLEHLPKEYIDENSQDDKSESEPVLNYKAPFSDTRKDTEDLDGDLKRLKEIPEIDVKEALKNCAESKDILIDTLKDFVLSAKSMPGKIEMYCKDSDIKNYTILVHGLKSSARLIGAVDLSDAAAFLEDCGDKQDLLQINQMTPYLLADFKKLGQNLEEFFKDINVDISGPFASGDETEAAESAETTDKPDIDQDTLIGVYAGIKEFVSAYDFKCAMDVLEMLSDYRLPPKDKEKAQKLYELIRNVDHDAIMELL